MEHRWGRFITPRTPEVKSQATAKAIHRLRELSKKKKNEYFNFNHGKSTYLHTERIHGL